MSDNTLTFIPEFNFGQIVVFLNNEEETLTQVGVISKASVESEWLFTAHHPVTLPQMLDIVKYVLEIK